jgi:hypothetical protein
MQIIDLLVNLPSPHPRALACPFTPEVLRARERAPTLFAFAFFTFGLIIEFIKELGNVLLCVKPDQLIAPPKPIKLIAPSLPN